SFVYAIGSFSFQKGPTHKVDIGTGFPANLGDAIGTVLGAAIKGLPTAPPTGSDQLWIAPDLSKIYNLEVDSMQIGASNVHVFAGIDGPYLKDTNKDGVIDSEDAAARKDALGVAINDVTFGMVTMAPTLNSLPGFEGLLPEYTALRATADSAKLVGFGSILTAEMSDIVVEVNNGEAWPGDIGPPVVDFSSSFDTDEVVTYFGGSDSIITVAEVRALAGSTRLTGRSSSDILDSAEVIAALGGTDGQLQLSDILSSSPTAAQVTAFSDADADGDGKLDPAGYEVRTGTSTAPVYLTYDGAQRIGASVADAELKVSQFYHLVGALSFEKGPTHKVDISTGISATTRDVLETLASPLQTEDLGNGTLWFEPDFSVIHNFEVDSLQLGGSGLDLFYGLGGPYWTGDSDGDGEVDDDEIDEDAVGLVATGIDFGVVEMNPTLSALPGLGDVLPKFQAASGTADTASFVGMDDVVMDLEGIVLNYNDGTEWQNGEGPPVVDFSTSFDDDEVVDFFAGTDADSVTVGDVRTVLGVTSVTGLFGSTAANTLILKSTDVIAALGGSDGQLQINEVLAEEATDAEIAAAWAADADGDGKLDPAGYEVRTGTGTAPVYLVFDGNQRIGASAEWVTVQLAEFVHVEGSIAFEMGPAETVRVADGFLSDLGATAGDFLEGIGLPASIVDNYPLFSSDTPNPVTEVSFMTVGAANVHAFIGFDGPYWTDLDGDRKIGWALPNGTSLTNTDGSTRPTRTVGGVQYGDLNGNGTVEANETAELDGEAAGLAIEEFDYGMAIMTPLDQLDPSKYYSVSANADSVKLVGIDDVTAEASKLRVDVNMSSPSFKGLSLFSVVDFASTTKFASEQAVLFDRDKNGLTYGDLVTLNNALPTTNKFAGISAISEGDLSKPVEHDRLVEFLNTNDIGDSRGVIDITEAAALLGGSEAAVTSAQTADKDGDGKIDPLGYEVGTGGVPVYLAMDGPIIRAQGFVDLNLLDTVYVSGSLAFEWGGTEDVILTDGTKKTVTTATIGAANVSGFVGSGGPYWTDLDGDQKVSWTDAKGSPTSTDTNSDGVVDANETSELNSNAVGIEVTDLDVGVMLMASVIPADLGIYLAGKLSVKSFGLVGVADLTATGAFDVALNVGVGVEGLSPVDFDATYSEIRELFDAIDTTNNGTLDGTEYNVAFGTKIARPVNSPEELVDFLNLQRFAAIDTSNNGIIEATELSAAITGDYTGESVTTVEQLVRALNVGGAPQTTDLTYLRTILSTTLAAQLGTFDADSDGKLDRGFEVNTGNPDAPVVLDFEKLLIRIQLGGEIELKNVFRMNGVFIFEVQGGDSPSLKAFAAANLEFGPDIGASDGSRIFNMSALGALVLNSSGIAADIDVSVSVGGALSSVLRLEANARLVINTTGADQSITIPAQFVAFMSGSESLTSLPLSTSLDTTSESPIFGLAGKLDSRFTRQADGSATFTIAGGAPRLDGKTDPAGAYIFVSVDGKLTIASTFVIDGAFALKISTTGLELGFNGELDLGGFASVTVAGGAVIENGVFAAYVSLAVGIDLDPLDVEINGTAELEINSSGTTKSVSDASGTEHQILANTYKVTATAEIDFFGVLTADGTVEFGVENGQFVIGVDAVVDFLSIVDVDISGYFNTDGTFSFSGTINLDLTVGSGLGRFGVDGGIGLAFSDSGVSGHGSVGIVVVGQKFNVASASFSLNWDTGATVIRVEGPLSVWVQVSIDSDGSFGITGGLGVLDAVVKALGKAAEAVGKAAVAAAEAVAGAAVAAVEFIGGVVSDIGAVFSDIGAAIGKFFSNSKTEVHQLPTPAPRYQYGPDLPLGLGSLVGATLVDGTLTINNQSADQISVTKVGNDLLVDGPDFVTSVPVATKVSYSRSWFLASWKETGRSDINSNITFSNQQRFSADDVTKIVIEGTNRSETFILSDNIDIDTVVRGRGGNDTIVTGAGNDRVEGGDGNDTIFTKAGDDVLLGGTGDDKLMSGLGSDTSDGGAGDDLLDENEGRSNTVVTLSSEINILRGGAGNDIILGSPGKDTIDGGSGNDLLSGTFHDDTYEFDEGYGTDQFVDVDGDVSSGHEILDFSGATSSLSFTLADSGFTATGGSGNLLNIGSIVQSGSGFTWIEDVKLGSGSDTATITALPTHLVDLIDAAGDAIDLTLNSTGHDIYLHPAAVLMGNLHVSFDAGLKTLNLTDDATATRITTQSTGPDKLLVKSGVTIKSSTGGDIEMLARGDFALQTEAHVETAGKVTIRGDHANVISGGSTIDLIGTVKANRVAVHGNIDNDTVNVTNVTSGSETTISAGNGDDTVNVGTNAGISAPATSGTVNRISARLTINGDEGTGDTLNVDDLGEDAASNGRLTSSAITGLFASGGSLSYRSLETLNIDLGSAADTLTVQSTHAGSTTINTWGGADTIHIRASAGSTTLNAGDGADTINVAGLAPVFDPGAGGDADGVTGQLRINGDGSDDTLSVDDSGDGTGDTGRLEAKTISGIFGAGGSITYNTFEALQIDLGSGGDRFAIANTHDAPTIVSAGVGNDDISISATTGTLTVNGNAGDDRMTANHNGAALILNGDDNDDTINLDGSGAAVTINAGADTDTVNINGVSHILIVNGQAGPDTINTEQTAASSDSTLNGDGGDDVFNVRAMDGRIDIRGGDGSDTVNVSDEAPRLPVGARTLPTGSIDRINALLDVDGGDGPGEDVLNVDDSRASSANHKTGTLTPTSLRGLELDSGIDYVGLENLNIWLGSGDNTFDINDTHAGETTLKSSAGADTVNVNDASGILRVDAEQDDDVVNVRATGLQSSLVINAHEGEDTVNISSKSPSTPSPAATVGSIDGIDGAVAVFGGAGSDTINVDDSADSVDRAGTLTATTLRGLGLPGGVDYTGAEDFNLWLGAGADVLFVNSTHTGTTQIYGGDGNATTNERDDTIAINTIAGATTVHAQAGNDFVEVGVNAPVLPQNGAFDSLDPISGFFSRTHVNGLGALLNLHGEGDSDQYTLNLAGQGTALINVHDNGAPNDGVDTLFVNGADTVAGVQNQPNDTFLLRKDVVALLSKSSTRATAFDRVERVNYDENINARLVVSGLGGDDKIVADDNSTITTLDGGDGIDTFQIGQVFGTPRDAAAGLTPNETFETTPIIVGVIEDRFGTVIFDPSNFSPVTDTLDAATVRQINAAIAAARPGATPGVAYVSQGVTHATTIFGGEGGDIFNIYHNKGTLRLEGEGGNDEFVVRAFVTIDLSEQGLTEVKAGAGNDVVNYAINAPVSLDGGTGFDKVVVLGTPFNDSFVVTSEGIFGAGLNVKFDNIESAELDTLEGNDTISVLGTRAGLVTTVIGGLGDDRIDLLGDVLDPIVSDDGLGRSGVITHGVTSTGSDYNGVGVDGIGLNIVSPGTSLVNLAPTGAPLIVSENGDQSYYFINLVNPDLAALATNPVYLTVSAGLASSQDRRHGGDSIQIRVNGGAFTNAVVLTFDGETANTKFQIDVMAVDDLGEEGDRLVVISHSINSDSAVYDDLPIINIFVDVRDNDKPALDIRHQADSTTGFGDNTTIVLEGDSGLTDTYSVVLTRAPAAGETVRVDLTTDSQVIATSQTTGQPFLEFDASNWHTTQLVLVQAARDGPDGTEFSTIVHEISGGTVYGEITSNEYPTLEVTVYDEDTPSVIVEQNGGSTIVVENGATDFYRLRLTSRPQADVTLTLRTDMQTKLKTSATGFAVLNESGPDFFDYSYRFTADNWHQWAVIEVVANPDFDGDSDPIKLFPPVAQNLDKIRGLLNVEGGIGPGEARTLEDPVLLPGEISPRVIQNSPESDESDDIDTLNVFHSDNNDADTGDLSYRTSIVVDQQAVDIANPGLALTGFEMGGDLSTNQGTPRNPVTVYYGGGITVNGFEIVEVLLGKGDETLSITDTTDRDARLSETLGPFQRPKDPATITAIHGGGGNDTFTISGRGDGPLVVYGDTSEDRLRYSNTGPGASVHGTGFSNDGDDVIDARQLADQNDVYVGVVAYGGFGNDTIWGSQGDDHLAGGTSREGGRDSIHGQAGNDHIYGDSHFNVNLRLFAEDVQEVFASADSRVSQMFEALTTTAGDDADVDTAEFREAAGTDEISGGLGADIIFGDHGVITIEQGTRRLTTTGSVERIETALPTSGAADIIYGHSSSSGSPADDQATDWLFGGQGGDSI
ncbi:MAG: hypothetical protein HOH74_03955, partial [Gemmatimonadetes bacterium]|nr:hypothetical protein [Gemmatimonadota bacterium]